MMTRSKSRRMKRESNSRSENTNDKDMLSHLPSEILLHILSFIKIKDVVRTSILSKRWKDLWKCLPDLMLNYFDFNNYDIFCEFVSGIVSYRDGNHPLRTLDFHRHSCFRHQILTNLMTYAMNHNIQQLKIVVPYNLSLPNCVFSCRSLTSLHISVSSYDFKCRTKIPDSLELPSLLSLHLNCVPISTDKNGHAEPFSTCKKLNTLYIDHCVLLYLDSVCSKMSKVLKITNTTLANLIMDYTHRPCNKIMISTPKLTSFTLNGSPFHTLRGKEWVEVIQSSRYPQL